jgi:hypothetical protein
LPARDTPYDAEAFPPRPDGLSSAAIADRAAAAWRSVALSIAGTPHVRISRGGGRTYPVRHTRPLPADPPGQPCTIQVYDPGTGTGRVLALDLDRSRGGGPGDPAAQVSAQAEAIAGLIARLGGRCVTDVSPSGGRHVFAMFAAALPWRELRDVARALALRFPAVDSAPMASLGGQISSAGARHKSGGWRVLTTSLEAARAAVARRSRLAGRPLDRRSVTGERATRGSVSPPWYVRRNAAGERLTVTYPRTGTSKGAA